MTLVSVIIPAFNAANTIEQTIKSVLNQTLDANLIEIIIVNDGSSDHTTQIIAPYLHRFKLISTANRGVSAARNTGYEHATGDYIQYLDADDLLAPNKLEWQVNSMKSNNSDIAYGNWEKFKIVNGKIEIIEIVDRAIIGRPEIALFRDFWCPPAAILYSRKICDKIGLWKTSLPIIQDARYLLDAALCEGKFTYTNNIVASYRLNNANSLSTNNKNNFVNDCFQNAIDIAIIWKQDFKIDLEKRAVTIEVFRYCLTEFSLVSFVKMNLAIDQILNIEPNYIPTKSWSLHYLSKVFGYRIAEHFAAIKRRLAQYFSINR